MVRQNRRNLKITFIFTLSCLLVAIKGHSPYYKLVPGTMTVKEDGSNGWDSAGSNHFYLVEDRSLSEVQHIINDLMMHQPR